MQAVTNFTQKNLLSSGKVNSQSSTVLITIFGCDDDRAVVAILLDNIQGISNMKNLIVRTFSLPVVLWCAGIAAADSDRVILDQREYPKPAEYCFNKLAVRGKSDAVIVEYNLVAEPEEYFRQADIYVVATFKSKPGTVRTTNGFEWVDVNHPLLGPVPYKSFDELQPITPISVFYHPADVRAAVGDGEIWIGYGFRSENESTQASFDEMISSGRFELIWKAGHIDAVVEGSTIQICLTTTGMTATDGIARTSEVSP